MPTRREFVAGSAAAMAVLAQPKSAFAAQDKITIAIGDEPSTVDHAAVSTGVDYSVAENYGEYLIARAPNGDLVPGLATSWTVSPDGKTMDIVLRKGVKFHSGDAFTAQDVVFSIEKGREKSSTTKTRLALVEKAEVVDESTVRLHFKTPDVTFIPNRCGGMMLSKAYYDKVGDERASRQPVGTGPYKFVRYQVGEGIDLERFDGYWGEKPSIASARILFVQEDTTRVAKLQAGEVDLINACPYFAVKNFEGNNNFDVVKLDLAHPTMSIVFETQNPKVPWHDKRVRLALAHAVDCDAIIKGVLFGIPQRLAFLAPYELGYDANLKPYAFDPARAKALLAEAGYPNGFDMKFYFAATGRVQMNPQVAEAVASYFNAVGVRTQLVGEEWLAYRSRYNKAREPNSEYVGLFTHGRANSTDPTYQMNLFFKAGGPISIYKNPELDALNAKAQATVDPAERGKMIQQMVKIIQDEVPSFPVYNNVAVYAMKKSVKFVPTQKYNFDLTNIKDMSFKA